MGGQAIPNKPDEVGNACVCKGLQKGNIVGRVCFGRRNKLNEKEQLVGTKQGWLGRKGVGVDKWRDKRGEP